MKVNGYEIWPEANLTGAALFGASLRGADLREANLRGASLRGADLREANLRWADLSEADLSKANLVEADLGGADLVGADLRETNLAGALHRGQIASELVVRLALIGACTEAILWAWGLDPACSWRAAWEAARADWKSWLGGSYEDAVEKLMSVEVKP